MKFAKELERSLVPEWRVKYLNYKAGKKHVKAVTRAVNRAKGTPKSSEPLAQGTSQVFFDLTRTFTPTRRDEESSNDEVDPLRAGPAPVGKGKAVGAPPSAPETVNERSGLAISPNSGMIYGGFVPTPPADENRAFELPAPAIKVPSKTSEPSLKSSKTVGFASRPQAQRNPSQRSTSMAVTWTSSQVQSAAAPGSENFNPRQRLARLFSTGSPLVRRPSKVEIGLRNLDDVRDKEYEFFAFLDSELDKIETFYKLKEDQATERLELLREQLHEMRDRRTAEIAAARIRRASRKSGDIPGENGQQHTSRWIDPLRAKLFKPGPNSKALVDLAKTPVMTGQSNDERRDYVRRPQDDVPYRTAKRKLKLALQEFYRGLELLKSYAMLNRTAFRKVNKKYDKAVNARPPLRYVNEKVNSAYFVTSDVVDGHLRQVEDLYARYFERGNRKLAAGKLRNLVKRSGDASGSAFWNGLLVGIGGVFAIHGLIYGAELLFDPDPVIAQHTSYLMQLYGGYFLMLYLFVLFTLDCHIWTETKVNYPFIFEIDTREPLDWKQLAEFPCFFFCLFGIIMYLNFSRYGNWEVLFLYYPVLLIGITFVILFFPASIFHYKSRTWFLYSHYRLFFAGLYPVEFRDFFLGDMWCSLTYAFCNVELFFCLYDRHWNSPEQCNSSHSRLMGFIGAVPPIWRALQCIRRYHDTENVFPHLVNCGKYSMSILSAVFLSLYRINGTDSNLALLVVFSAVNAVYCTIWDLFMDVSLLQVHSKHFLLRDILALKSRWPYYLLMVVDPILRFSWIFYAIFTHDAQHSTLVSFLIGFAEVTRRGLWTIFRVENEHCANVAQYKASRDVPLPYHFDHFVERPSLEAAVAGDQQDTPASGAASGRSTGVQPPGSGRTAGDDEEGGTEVGPAQDDRVLRRRQTDGGGKRSILQVMAEAHKQDFEKKWKPPQEIKPEDIDDDDDDAVQTDEEDGDNPEDGVMLEEEMEIREAEESERRGTSE